MIASLLAIIRVTGLAPPCLALQFVGAQRRRSRGRNGAWFHLMNHTWLLVVGIVLDIGVPSVGCVLFCIVICEGPVSWFSSSLGGPIMKGLLLCRHAGLS